MCGESDPVWLPEHRINAHIRSGDHRLAHLTKAELLVKRHIARVLGVEVARQALRSGLPEHGAHKLAAETVTLICRINAQRPDIPARSRRRLLVRPVSITGGL
jgi:hypothetical protein